MIHCHCPETPGMYNVTSWEMETKTLKVPRLPEDKY